ncbi:FAD/NAD(P)-binding protein [Lacticaseibacillus baoqingensis]|uniref:FAD/NAD(P)-binding protein n=1 Tax=Lacticaseibacillus baoqingensis TaxID=2486013 RepID=A0ABW4E943_9LACO|nr:FAD/NAD(P)-binding protein [Lacticaseibacillus baoqingensis]
MKVALIGAGPRGLLLLERLLAWYPHTALKHLEITLYDPFAIGGRIWTPAQSPYLLMNTAASQITLFYDQTVASIGPYVTGPTLAQWARHDARAFLEAAGAASILIAEAQALTANDYASRALYGYYQRWVYARLLAQAPPTVSITHQQTTVQALTRHAGGFELVTTAAVEVADTVVLALGNTTNALSAEQKRLVDFAYEHQLLYWPPALPAEGDLSTLTASDTVILRGLGLSFHDLIARLTNDRGGRFSRDAQGTLHYHPSGNEPKIIAGSRRGLPPHAKGRNQKAPGEQVQPVFLTPAQLDTWQAQGPLSKDAFMTALKNDAAYVYYSLLLAQRYPKIELAAFQQAFSQDPQSAIKPLPLKPSEYFDWSALFTAPQAATWAQAVNAYLQADVEAAGLGTKTGPLTSALEVLRDLRDAIRQIVLRQLLAPQTDREWFLRTFNRDNTFLSIGPPLRRHEELLALIAAQVVTILPPEMQVQAKHGAFIATSKTPGSPTYHGTALIEARVAAVSARTAQNPLIKQLLRTGLANVHTLPNGTLSGALAVDPDTLQLLDAQAQVQPHLFCWGPPIEGIQWLTNASPRPLVNDTNLRQANQIAALILFDRLPEQVAVNF